MSFISPFQRITWVGAFLLIAASIISSLVGCATTVQAIKESPASYPEAAELRRVALIGFKGKYDKEVNAAFETMLVNHRFEEQPYFTVADRARTHDLMREYKKSLSGEIDPSTAVRFGKQIGVSGIYFGDIANFNLTSENLQSTQSYCKRYSSDGSKCKEQGTRRVTCRERIATLTLIPRLVNVETGQVVYRAQHNGRSSSTACPGSNRKQDSILITEAITSAILQIQADIAPTTALVRVELMEKPSGLIGQDAEEFGNGMEFSKAKRMDRACQIWRQLNQRVQATDNALLYNVAVCEELDGNLEKSLAMYRQVDSRLTRPDTNVSNALTRVQSTLATN